MRKYFSIKHTSGNFNLAMLLLRIVFGGLMIIHGFDKLSHFAEKTQFMPNFLGLGGSFTLILVIFAEFLCSLFVILGLFTRFAAIPLIFTMCYVTFAIHGSRMFIEGETALLFLAGFIILLLLGPGRYSLDSMLNTKR